MSYCLMVGFDYGEQDAVVRAFKYASSQIDDRTTRRIVSSEFVHSLNRKGIVPNSNVDDCVDHLMR